MRPGIYLAYFYLEHEQGEKINDKGFAHEINIERIKKEFKHTRVQLFLMRNSSITASDVKNLCKHPMSSSSQ